MLGCIPAFVLPLTGSWNPGYETRSRDFFLRGNSGRIIPHPIIEPLRSGTEHIHFLSETAGRRRHHCERPDANDHSPFRLGTGHQGLGDPDRRARVSGVSAPLAACLATLGFAGAFVAGLLGIGGAIVMIPLLLYVPASLGLGALDMKVVSALTMVQVFFAAAIGAIAHGVRGSVQRELAVSTGAAAALGSLIGGISSRWVSSWGLLLTFALMASMGAGLLWASPVEREADDSAKLDGLSLSRPSAAAVGLAVGIMAGLVGAGGAFLLIPLLITALKVPTRIAIGSSLAITIWAAATGFLGKLVTAQIPFGPAVALVLGALPGAGLGEWASRRTRVRTLRGLLTTLIALVAVRVWIDVILAFR